VEGEINSKVSSNYPQNFVEFVLEDSCKVSEETTAGDDSSSSTTTENGG